jgi:hypothetical protein
MTESPNLGNELAGNRFECSGAIDVTGLGDIIGGAQRQRFQGYSCALFGQAAEHDDRNAAVDFAQFANRLEAVHLRHLDVEQDDIRFGSQEFRHSDAAIDCRGSHFKRGILADRS